MKEFSIYNSSRGIRQVKPTGTIDLEECAELIRSDPRLIKMTAKLRGIKDDAAQQEYKLKLPYVTFAGTFTNQATDGLLERSEYFMIDLDHIKNIDETMFAIWDSFKPAMMFVSPRGNGLKVIYRLDPGTGEHEQFFTTFKNFFKSEFDLSIDEKCKNISRATFLCHDPHIFFTEDSDIFCYELLQYNKALDWADNQEPFTEGNRNQYIADLAGKCHRLSVPEKFVNNQLASFTEDGFSLDEIQRTVKSIYGNTVYDGIEEEKTCDYIRVGTTFFKKILKKDRYGIEREELKVWNRVTITGDHKKGFLKVIPKFDDFIMKPNNLEIQTVIDNCYNQYSKFAHTPAAGEWVWTKRLMEHIFGEQYPQGIRYMQMLYLHPERSTIILAIVSRERVTGKTTFVNWINMLFGENVIVINSKNFASDFNPYATKNIICIEETLFDKKLTIEKLKDLTTTKQLQVNEKYIPAYKLPFYGKIILTSNNEENFARIDPEEVRFFVRKVGKPKFKNHSIETNLLAEIPAFLDYLKSLDPVDWSVDRSGFTGKELANKALQVVVEESRSTLYKELEMLIIEFFQNNEDREFFFATPTNFKIDYFFNNINYSRPYISRVLREDFKMKPERLQRYKAFNEETETVGTPYCFHRVNFVNTCKKDFTD